METKHRQILVTPAFLFKIDSSNPLPTSELTEQLTMAHVSEATKCVAPVLVRGF